MRPADTFALTPGQLVFIYEEMQRERALERANFLNDVQVALAAAFSKDGAKEARSLTAKLEKFALGSSD